MEGTRRLKANCLTLAGGETAVGRSSGGCNYCVIVSVALPGRQQSVRGAGCRSLQESIGATSEIEQHGTAS